MAEKVIGFDGTVKAGNERVDKTHNYASENAEIKSRTELREGIMDCASDEAIEYLSPYLGNISGPTVECDAEDLTPDDWQRRRRGDRTTGRKGTIGASASSHVMGTCPYSGPCTNLDLYHQILGDEIPDKEDDDASRQIFFDLGHFAEGWLQEWVEKNYPGHRVVIDTRIFCDQNRSWMTANLDFMLQKPDGSWVHGEFKTTNSMSAKTAYANGAIPPQYVTQLIQCQHLLNVDESLLVCAVLTQNAYALKKEDMNNPAFNFGNFVERVICRTYIRDLDAEMNQIKAMDDFWVNHILPEIPPKPNSKSSANNIAAVNRWIGVANPKAPVLKLPKNYVERCEEVVEAQNEVQRLKKLLAAAESRVDELSIPLMTIMDESVKGSCMAEDGTMYRIDYKGTPGRDSFDLKLLKANRPTLYKELLDAGYVKLGKKQSSRKLKISIAEEW